MTQRFDLFVFWGVLFSILLIAFIPKEIYEQTRYFEHDDKIKHFIAFFVLSLFYFKESISLDWKLKFLILGLLAFCIEVFQSFLGREFSLYDFLASVSGVVGFIVLRNVIMR